MHVKIYLKGPAPTGFQTETDSFVPRILKFRPFRSLVAGFAAFALAGCLVMDEGARELPGDSAPVGYARIQLTLEKNQSALGKSAANDTTFQLDSLIMVFSASGASTVRVAQPISGRADTGAITVSGPVVSLPGLRNWKAYVYTIDEQIARRDTVHLDSVVFAVHPADTAVVQKSVSPAFAILKVRVVSNTDAQVPDSVRFVRLRVDGVVRDSQVVGSAPATATLNWVRAMPTGNVVHAVGNHGRVLRSANSGVTWTEIRMPEEDNLVSGFATDAGRVYNISNTGLLRWSTDGGVTWAPQNKVQVTSSPSDTLRRMYMSSSTRAYAVGRNGGIYGIEGGWNAGERLISNTTNHLNSVHFPSEKVGYVVGENETILRTTNGDANINHAASIVWTPISGGWFQQTSETTNEITAIQFTSATRGWAMGKGGLLRLTTNGGAKWDNRTGLDNDNINAFHMNTANTGYVVGDGGVIRQYNNEWSWPKRTSGTSNHLYDVRIVGMDTMYIVGANGTIRRSTNASTTAWPYVTFTAQSVPSVTTDFRSVYPVTSRLVFVSGANGRIAKTTNAGVNWTVKSTGTTASLNGIAFRDANNGFAVGGGGTILKTTDGGETWVPRPSGTTVDLWSVVIVTADTAYASGANGTIVKTGDAGETWYTQETFVPTQRLNRLHAYSKDIMFAVGQNGTILKAVNHGENWTGGGIKRSFKAVHFVNVSTGWVVGEDGIILKTTDSGNVWVEQHRQNGLMLHAVHFQNANVGWVTGANGEVFKTTNGGATWAQQATIVTTIPLTWISFRNTSEGFIIGGTNSLYSTTNGGTTWNALFAGGMPGARIFDQILAYKYLKPGKSHTILVEAIDRVSPSLRGYQASFSLTPGAGQDITILQPLTRCGHVTANCQ